MGADVLQIPVAEHHGAHVSEVPGRAPARFAVAWPQSASSLAVAAFVRVATTVAVNRNHVQTGSAVNASS